MKFFFISLVFISIAIENVLSQNVLDSSKFITGDIYRMPSSVKHYNGIIGADSNHYYGLRFDYAPEIEKFDSHLNLIETQHIIINKRGYTNSIYEKIVFFEDSLYLFYSVLKFNNTYLYFRTIDKASLELNKDERLLIKFDNTPLYYPTFHISMSKERHKILVLAKMDMNLRKHVELRFLALGKGMEIDWIRNESLDYTNRIPTFEQICIDDSSNVHILSLIYEIYSLENIIGNPELKNEYHILSILDKGEILKSNQFHIPYQYIRNIEILPGPYGIFYCVGTFSDEVKFGSTGIFFTRSNPLSLEIEPARINFFNDEFVSKIQTGVRTERKTELYGMNILNVSDHSNQQVTMILEQEFNQGYNNINDLLLFNFTESGNLLWQKVINKKQSGDDFISAGIVAPYKYDYLGVVFNDHGDNELNQNWQTKKLKSFTYNNSYTKIVLIGLNGSEYTQAILPRNKKMLLPDWSNSFDLRDGTLVVQFKHPHNNKISYSRIFF